MRTLRVPLLLVLALGLTALAQAGVTTYTYTFSAPQVQVVQGQTTVIMDGMHTWARVGAPLLPMGPVQLLLPPGEEAVSISVETAAPIVLGQGYRISHRLQPYPLSLGSAAQPTPADAAIYNSNDAYPAQAAGDFQTQFYAGHSIAYAALHPVTYRPVSGELAWYPWIRVTITSRPTARSQESYNTLLRVDRKADERLAQLVQNPETIPVYGEEQPTRPAGWDMLLITPQSFAADYQAFADAKTRSGIMTKIVTTEFIYANYPGADNQTKIRNCIIDYYHNQGISYVYLGGDNEQIPHRGLYCVAGYTDNDIAADLYYAALDGNWNADGDTHWGEPGEEDYVAEVYIGRNCGDTSAEIAHLLNKTTMYENTPVGNQITTGLMTGEDLGWPVWAWQYKEEIRLGSTNWGYTTVGFPANFAVDTLYERPGYYWSAMTDLLPKLNQGPNLVNHLGHGNTGLVMQFYTSNITDANFTNNGTNRNFFIAYSQACYSGSFDNRSEGGSYGNDCICEEFTTIAHAAVAYECNSRYGWGDLNTTNGPSQHFDRQFFDALFAENLTTLGKMNGDSKEDNIWLIPSDNTIRWCYYELNLLGDPTLDVWTATPSAFNPAYQNVVLLGSSTFQVSGIPNGSLATMSLNNVVLGQGTANQSGVALVTFDAPLTQLGNITLMVTRHNYLPYTGTVEVIPPSGPYVIYNSSQINDATIGNNNGQWDFGETTDLNVRLKNVGIAAANNVNATLSEADPLVTVIDSTAAYGTINAGDSVMVANAFRVQAAANTPDQHTTLFTVTATATGYGPWTSNFSLVINAPVVVKDTLVIQDPAPGNNNGQLDPGENTTFVLTMANDGHMAAQNVAVSMSCATPGVTITGSPANYGNLNPGASAARNYGVVAASSIPSGTEATFTLAITANGGYSNTQTFTLVIGDVRNMPSGPDAYGYKAWDNMDGGESHPYNWIEISPRLGGPGTGINFTIDDQTFQFNLPFNFRYYGADFTQVSICNNGWIAMGYTTSTDYTFTGIPNSDGPPNMIAPYWHDLSPQLGGQVSYYYNASQHYYVVEYDTVRHYSPTTSRETFEIMLYDPAYYGTSTGDGIIEFQYKLVTDGTESTVGIENQAQTVGIQYGYNGAWDTHAWPIQAGRTITFSTNVAGVAPEPDVTLTPLNPPIVIPANGGSFQFTASVINNGDQAPFNVWARIKNPDGSYTAPTLGPVLINPPVGQTITRQRTQNIPGAWPPGTYTYLGYANATFTYPALDSSWFTFTKSTTADGGPEVTNSWCWGELFEGEVPVAGADLPAVYSLAQCHPNPFNPATTISYGLPQPTRVSLKVFDLQGRLVADLVEGMQEAGMHSVSFDGSKLSSGLYFYRLQAGSFTAVRKMMLVK